MPEIVRWKWSLTGAGDTSRLIRDRDLAEGLAIGFDGLWKKAMKDLAEISFQPVPPAS